MPVVRTLAVLLILGGLSVSAEAQGPLRWESQLEPAVRQAAAQNRLVLLHFGASWCGPCRKLETTVFNQPNFGAPLVEQYVAVKLDVDQHAALAKKLGVTAVPTDVIMTPQGQLLYKTLSPDTAEKYTAAMLQIAERARQTSLASNQTPGAPGVPPAAPLPPGAQPPISAQPVSMPVAPAPGVPQGPTASAEDDRYGYYYRERQGGPAPVAPPAVSAVAPQVVAPVAAPPLVPQGALAPSAPPVATQPPLPAAPPAGVVAQPASPKPPITQAQLPPGSPPLGLDGFCPVSLCERKQWVQGDVSWGAVHRGRTYVFVGQAEQQRFLSNPDRYSPVLSGADPVLSLNHGQSLPGRREHGVFFGERIFLFHSEETLNEFARNPNRYAAEVTSAMR